MEALRYVYLIQESKSKRVKVGFSKHPKKRLKQHQTGNPEKLTLLYQFDSHFASKIESSYKFKYKTFKQHGEWYSLEQIEINKFLSFCKQRHENFIYIEKLSTY
jgi:predicted GIY-YIG superfamily endonuclease